MRLLVNYGCDYCLITTIIYQKPSNVNKNLDIQPVT